MLCYYASSCVIYMYHQYIVRFMLTGAFAHGTIFFFFIRDYYLEQNEDKQSREQEKKKTFKYKIKLHQPKVEF